MWELISYLAGKAVRFGPVEALRYEQIFRALALTRRFGRHPSRQLLK